MLFQTSPSRHIDATATMAQSGLGSPLGLAAEIGIVHVVLVLQECKMIQECVSHGGLCQCSRKLGRTSCSRLDYLHGAPGQAFHEAWRWSLSHSGDPEKSDTSECRTTTEEQADPKGQIAQERGHWAAGNRAGKAGLTTQHCWSPKDKATSPKCWTRNCWVLCLPWWTLFLFWFLLPYYSLFSLLEWDYLLYTIVNWEHVT